LHLTVKQTIPFFMKHTTLLLTLMGVLAFTGTKAQIDSTKIFSTRHEIKLGAVKLLAAGVAEVTYEYIHSPYFTYGASILGNFDQYNSDTAFDEDFSVTPFVRFYFTEPRKYGAKGFFVEGFAKYINGRKWDYDYDDFEGDWDYHSSGKYNAGSVGLTLGWKWINHTGFVFEILGGAGRNFTGDDDAPNVSGRFDLYLGYRF
jgi:hypothetical protein